MTQILPIDDVALFFEVSVTSKKSTSTQELKGIRVGVEEMNFVGLYPEGYIPSM